ncbi:MAG: hypothetical protein EOP88_15925 [Verrucomicrobiaceae bacterium]|nr:MAG: hypothetical protein EOP88_15925 [Verrucomicrobiaceae bacterium]
MNYDLIQQMTATGCFLCDYPLTRWSVAGKDHDEFIHGEIYGGIVSISESIHFWNPPAEVMGNDRFTKGPGGYRSIRACDFPEALPLHEYLNLCQRERGSIAFHVKGERWEDLVSIIAKSDRSGVMGSKNAVVRNHSPASWKWARQVGDSGDFALMVGRQTGAGSLDVFMRVREATRFLNDCIAKRKAEGRYSSFWPTEPYDEIYEW